jgi:hypothetical protein
MHAAYSTPLHMGCLLFLVATRKLQCAKGPFIRLIQRVQLILGIRDSYASTFHQAVEWVMDHPAQTQQKNHRKQFIVSKTFRNVSCASTAKEQILTSGTPLRI